MLLSNILMDWRWYLLSTMTMKRLDWEMNIAYHAYELKMKLILHPKNNRRYRHRFDFEIGYLIKSPCRECAQRKTLPKCMETCNQLDKIQTILSESISCAKKN